MEPVRRDQLVDYATWTDIRAQQVPGILETKRVRRVHLGEHLTFLFENADTVRYQVQEMMRVERIVREADIVHELDTYNELLGGDGELGCTLLIEIDDPGRRDTLLTKWLGLPETLYVEAGGQRFPASFDPRQVGDTRLSSVQYLKFDTRGRVPDAIGCGMLDLRVELTDEQKAALAADLT